MILIELIIFLANKFGGLEIQTFAPWEEQGSPQLINDDMKTLQDIRQAFYASVKVQGCRNEITLADGKILAGCYYLTESGTVVPSHDVLSGFALSEGFPTDGNGCSVNDRDYQRDHDAQETTRRIAREYDARALQSPVIVSPDGIVLSGNGRTMAGELAAYNGTDGAYITHISKYCGVYGFTPEQVLAFSHPRIIFVINDSLDYTAETFARFNQQDTKRMSKTEQAIKFGKTVRDDVFSRILSVMNAFETLGDFYGCLEASTRCINELRTSGVIDAMSYAEMFDGDSISAAGRETLENVLIGKAFASDSDAARKITTYKSLRKSVVSALSEVVNNLSLGDAYTINYELSQAVNLAYVARQHGYRAGERVSEYARQIDAFTSETVCDFKDTVILTLADALNSEQVTILKRILAVYNHQAQDAANGQTDIFCDSGVKTKAEILEDVKVIFAKGTTKEQREAVTSANEARQAQNIFVMDDCVKQVKKGSYVEYRCASGDVIICHVDEIRNTIAYLSGKGGIKFWATVSELRATADHNLSLPSWLVPGTVITDEKSVSQRIEAVTDNFVVFEWINGGLFDMSIATILQSFRPSANNICEIIEAA